MSAPGWVTQYKFIERMNNEWFRWSYGKQFSPRKAAKFRGGKCFCFFYALNANKFHIPFLCKSGLCAGFWKGVPV